MLNKKTGFTLVELLVVVAIIAILATIGFAVYSKLLQNARDGKRQSDLRSIQSALEQYYADQFYYPLKGTSSSCPNGQLTILTAGECPFKSPTGTKTYLNSVPRDPNPSPTNQYRYEPLLSGCDNSTTKCTSYCLYADLENASIRNACQDLTGYDIEVSPP